MRAASTGELTGIEVVFFDAGETLVHPRPSFPGLLEAACADRGVRVDLDRLAGVSARLLAELDARQREGFTFSTSPEASEAFWLDFYARLLEGLGAGEAAGAHALPEHLYLTFSDPANYALYEDAGEALEELAAAGLSLGIISNFEPWLERLLESLGVLDRFHYLIISGQVGAEKPGRRIFEMALDRAGVGPARALHVGDSLSADVEGARAAGIIPVLIDRAGRHPGADCLRLDDLRDLAGLLADGGARG